MVYEHTCYPQSGSPLHPLRGEMSRSDRGGGRRDSAPPRAGSGEGPPLSLRQLPPQGGERDPDPLSPPCGGSCHGVTEGGSARQRPSACGQWGGTPPQPAAAPPARGERDPDPLSPPPPPPLRGELSRSDRGGVGATAPRRARAVGRDPPPQPAAAPPQGGSGESLIQAR